MVREEKEPEKTLTRDDLTALRIGLEQLDRGQGTDGVAFLESLRHREGLPARGIPFTRRGSKEKP